MNIYNSKKLLVLDTEYDTKPKRLLAIAYILYTFEDNEWKQKKYIDYIKYDKKIFKVNENGDSFKYHKLTNKFLQENGINIKTALLNLYNLLLNIDIIIGQNILSADIHIIRKEAIGQNIWYNHMKNVFNNIHIYDTMIAFREKLPNEKKSSLDYIYKYLFNKNIINHHNPIYDCENTFECFNNMVNNKYIFNNQIFRFSEDILKERMKECKKCSICKNKLIETKIYKCNKLTNIINSQSYKIHHNNLLHINDEICNKCFDNLEILITNNNNEMIDLVKLKYYSYLIKNFFNIIGNEQFIIYLISNYKDKNQIKKLGGKWDNIQKSWYFIYTSKTVKIQIEKFKKWIPINILNKLLL